MISTFFCQFSTCVAYTTCHRQRSRFTCVFFLQNVPNEQNAVSEKKTLLCLSSHSYFGFRNNLSWLGEQVGLPAWQRFPPSFPRDAKLPVQSPNHNFPGNVNYSNGYLLCDYTTSSANRGTVWLLKGLIRWTLNIWNFKSPTFLCATLNSRSKGSASTWKI